MKKIITWFKTMFFSKNKYKQIAEDLQRLVDDLHLELLTKKVETKEIFTFICPPSNENMQQYLASLSSFYNNPNSKWFFYSIERAVIAKFKQTDASPEFIKGALSMIDMISDGLNSSSEEFKKISSRVQNG